MSLSKVVQNTAFQIIGGIVLGSAIDNIFNSATREIRDQHNFGLIALESITQISVGNLGAGLFFDTISRFTENADDITRGFAFYFTMFATQPHLLQKLHLLSRNVNNLFNFASPMRHSQKKSDIKPKKPWTQDTNAPHGNEE